MDDKVQKALEARKKKKEDEKKRSREAQTTYINTHDDGVSRALKERQKKLASDVDEEYVNRFMTDLEGLSNEDDYNNVGWSNASSSYDSKYSTKQDLDSRSTKVRAWLNLNKDTFDDETYNGLLSLLDDFGTRSTSVVDSFKELADYYGQWKTEDEYKRATRYLKLTDDAKGAEDFADNSGYVSTKKDDWWARLTGNEYDKTYEYINDINGMRSEIEKDSATYQSDNPYSDGESTWKEKGYNLLTKDEISAYNYYYATGGKKKAEEYLDALQETLYQRKANKDFAGMKDKTALELLFGIEAGLDQFKSGVANAFNFEDDYIPVSATQLTSGMVREDLADNGPKIFGNSLGQVGYDLINTTSNMLPSILASTAANFIVPGSGAVIGAGLMGTSAAGNAYQEMLNLGYDKGQARTYSTLVGISEAGLQYALGGISKLGGKATSNIISKAISGIDNGLARFAIDLGGSLLSEGIEEGLQEVIDPLLKNAVLHADEDIDWSQVAYSSLLGSLSALGLDGVGTTVNHARYNSALKAEGNRIVKDGGVESLVSLANEMAGVADTDMAKSLSKRVDRVNGKNGVNAKAVGKLSEVVNETRSQLNKTDIVKALESKGVSSKKAQKYADALASMNEEYFAGKKSVLELGTNAQWKKITNDENAYAVLREVVTDMESSVNKRNDKYNYARQGIKVAEDGKLSLSDELAKKADDEILKGAYAKKAEDIDTAVSKDGKAKVVSTDAEGVETKTEVTINGIDHIETKKVKGEDGKTTNEKVVYLKVADVDGNESVVEMGDVEFGSRTDAVLYESFVAMDADLAHLDAFVKNFNEADYDGELGEAAVQYAQGFQHAYRYGWANMETELGANVFASKLTDSARNIAYTLGKETISKQTEAKQSALDTAVAERKASGKGKVRTQGKLHMEGVTTKKRTAMQNAGVGLANRLTTLGIDVYIYESHQDADGNWVDDRGEIADNGFYRADDGSIHIDINAGQLNASRGESSLMAYTLSHELVHFMRDNAPAEFKVFADLLYKWYGKKGVSIVELTSSKMIELDCDWDTAYEEVVADSCESFLTDSNIADRIIELQETNKGAWEVIRSKVLDFLKWMKSLFVNVDPNSVEGRFLRQYKDEIDHLYDAFYNTLSSATETFQWLGAGEVTTDAVAVEDTVKHSYRSLAEAAGFEAREVDGVRGYYRNGQKVTEVTVDDIEISPIGAMINYSLDKGDITKEDAKRQKEMFAKICTLACKTNDFAMTMQFVGSAVFTGMKANADKQYGTTYDFPSICTKTQAVIDAMSKKMVTLKRGLSSEEILEIYQEVFASGNPVPCPECYVFSRWIGIGGLLDNIYEYQTHYGKMSVADAAKAYAELHKKVAKYASENGISFGKAKGALTDKVSKTWTDLKEKIEKADNQGEKVKDSDRAKLKTLESEMVTVKALSWLDKVYFTDNPLDHNGNPKANPKVNKNFAVPVDVLFDLNKGDVFASKYSEAWGFRTTQGAGYGKAITPYAEAVLGEGILATNNTTKTIKDKAQGKLSNPFLEQRGMMDKNAKKALDRARVKQKIQAFLGGQRFQSTSDARYENASDYLLASLEMQAMRGRVQVYTKVDGAVPAFGAWGFSINQSLMPLGGGLDAKGNIIDTKVGGMNPKVAFKNRENHETAGTITIGVNDNHIRKMFAEIVRDFIIPYHASGGKANLVNAFRIAQDKAAKKDTFVRSTDYSRTQSDKVLSDDVLKWQGKTDAEIAQIHAVRDARLAILTGGKPNMDVVRGNRFLSALYDKFNGGEWDGVKIAKSKVESQIFPNEFWDESVTYEQSGKVTQDYLDYCDDLGFLHRFSGTVPKNGVLIPVNGYNERGERVQLTDLAYQYDEKGNKTNNIEPFFWKVLTDRRMYDNSGNYLSQKVVTLNDTTTDTVTNFAKKNDGRQYDAVLSMETADKIAGVKKSARKSALETYTEAQYNAFGWASYNDIITAQERETLFSRYADFKHNSNKYPVTRWGEAVIHSTECPSVIMYVKGSIDTPEITRIVRITATDIYDIEAIQREVVLYEQEQISQPYEAIESIYGEGIFRTDKKRDCVSFQEYLSREEGRDSGTSVSDNQELQDGEGSVGRSNADDRADGGRGVKRSKRQKAPTFYSYMGVVVDGVKQDKLGAASVINLLKGRGVKDEEIKWSGIETWLEGKKSVTKAELQEFIAGSQLQIEEEILDNKDRPFTEDQQTRLDEYEAKRDEVAKRLADEWKKITDTDFPIRNAGAGLESAVTNAIIDANLAQKKATFEGRLLEKLRKDLEKVIKDNDDFGFDSWKDALRSIHRHRRDFIGYYEMSTKDKAVIVKYCNALNAYNELPNMITDEDTNKLRSIALEADPWNRKIMEVKHEHNEEEAKYMTKWRKYSLDGGKNYREVLFRIPDTTYSNKAMYAHWDERYGVLAHARVQDFVDASGNKMLFIEELQSDWHNEGAKKGYVGDEARSTDSAQYREYMSRLQPLEERFDDLYKKWLDALGTGREDAISEKMEAVEDEMDSLATEYRNAIEEHNSVSEAVPDAPFRDTYHEFVLKRLIRMAAEEGYNSVGWTTADTQMGRWNPKRKSNREMGIEDAKNPDAVAFEDGYRIEYDQDIPKFLRKYGKKWGATVGKTYIDGDSRSATNIDVDWTLDNPQMPDELLLEEMPEEFGDGAFSGYNGVEVWSMPITDSMKDSVLYEGQVMYQRRGNGTSNRSLLANALEGAAQNDIEARRLAEYKAKIDLINAEEKELYETRERIKELSFAKGPKDTKTLKDLQDTATRLANRINTYDKQLLRLEATAPLLAVLEREKTALRKRDKQKMAEAVANYREKSAETLREVMKRNTESRKKNVESRKRTAMRGKIKRVVTDLNGLLNRGTKERNVKTDMQETVGSALKLASIIFNDDISNEDIVLMGSTMATEEEQKLLDQYAQLIAKRDSSPVDEAMRAINKMSDLNRKLADLFKREKARLNQAKISDAVNELASAYAELEGSNKDYVNFAYSEEVHKRLLSLGKDLKGTVAKDMSLAQLEEVYDAYKMIRHMVRESNSLFRMGKTEDLANKVTAVQEQILAYYKERENDPREGAKKFADWLKGFAWNEMKPITAFETLGADAYTELFWDAIKAESEWARWMEESKAFLDEQRNKYGYKSWKMEDAHEFTLPDGKVFRVTLQDMMSIYAYSKREQAQGHMTVGGFQFDRNKAYKDKKGKKRVHLSDLYKTDWTTITNIIGELTDEQRGYVDAVQSYLTDMGQRGNEVSEILYGIGIFNETAYFPLMSASDYLSSTEEALKKTQTMASLKNTGMTKQTAPNAENPIILQNFDDVVIGHIDKMAKYCTHVLAIENLRRVFDSSSADDNGGYVSTKAVIDKVFGESAKKYFEKYITDLNGGTLINDTEGPTMAMFSKFKATAVGASLSVIVQQPMAIIRAMDVIDLKHFILGKAGKAETKHLYDEIKKYAPVATIKEMGGFDVGSSRTAREYLGLRTDKGVKRVADWVNDASMWGAGKADELGWGIIWKAVKREVASTKGLEPGTAEFYEACGERFTEVIVRTQVYDSVNSRSGYMRSKYDLVKFATSFMGEPTTVVNQAYLAVLNANRAKSKADKRKAMRGLGRTMGVLMASTVLTTVAKSLVYAMRDDDDDEAFLERWAKHTGENLGLWGDLNPLTLLPYARDIVSVFEGWNVERPDMSLITNLITSTKRLLDRNDEEQFTDLDEVLAVIGDAANIFGIPAKNVIRDSKAIVNLFGDFFDDVKPTKIGDAFVRGVSGEEQSNAEALYDAVISGDTDRADVIKGNYKDEDAVENAMRTQVKEHYLNGNINGTTAEQYLVDYCGMEEDDAYWKILEWDNADDEDYDKYDEFISAVESGGNLGTVIKRYTDNGVEKDSLKTPLGKAYRDGTLSKSSVERALTGHFDMDSNDAYWTFDKWDYIKENGSSEGYSKYAEFYSAVESGVNLKSAIKRYTDHGVEAKTLASQITSYFKPLYKEMSNAERANIKGYLLNAYVMLGYKRSDKNKDINNWLKD